MLQSILVVSTLEQRMREGLSKVISELNIRNYAHKDIEEEHGHTEGTASTKILWPEQYWRKDRITGV